MHSLHTYVFTGMFVLVRGGSCPGCFVRGIFVWKVLFGVVLSVPLLSEYMCYNRKLNITFNFRLYMYEKNEKCSVTWSLTPPPSVTNCRIFSDPSPSSVTYFIDSPL